MAGSELLVDGGTIGITGSPEAGSAEGTTGGCVGTVGFIIGGVGSTGGTVTTGGAAGTDAPGVGNGFVAARSGAFSTGGKPVDTAGTVGCVEGEPAMGVETTAG